MKLNFLCLLFVIFAHPAYAQPYSLTDTTFFDKDWKPTVRDNHEYYRVVKPDAVAMPSQKLLKIVDRYRNGIVQMEGYVLADDTSKEMGLYRWYKPNGDLQRARLFDYHNSIRHFDLIASYLKKAEPCDSANIDLVTGFYKGKVDRIGYIPNGDIYDTCMCKMLCTLKEYNMFNEELYETWEYKDGTKDGWHRIYSYGRLQKQKYYKDGKKTGIKMKFTNDGKLKKVKGLPKGDPQTSTSP